MHAYLQYNSVKSILGVNINSMVLVMGCDYPDPSLALTNLLISLSLSGAVLDVALIIFEVWDSDSSLIHLWPGTRLHTWVGGGGGGGGGGMKITVVESQAKNVKKGQHAPTKRNGHPPSPSNTHICPNNVHVQSICNLHSGRLSQ